MCSRLLGKIPTVKMHFSMHTVQDLELLQFVPVVVLLEDGLELVDAGLLDWLGIAEASLDLRRDFSHLWCLGRRLQSHASSKSVAPLTTTPAGISVSIYRLTQ